ncbi:Profilin [Mycena indigotica]|uniref:Profilin n=1 Tax=Mycena indigotica TaxID=2126181 RepID=A0A8H6SEV2_9AGAR|nr:Profilin [Mycena indigotica]KAF7297480.1 Profilin [Mycena indigotica]
MISYVLDSWQAYVNNMLSSGKITHSAIFGLDGSGTWASSWGYDIYSREQTAIIAAFNDPAAARAHGLALCGNRFMVYSVDGGMIYGRGAISYIIRHHWL